MSHRFAFPLVLGLIAAIAVFRPQCSQAAEPVEPEEVGRIVEDVEARLAEGWRNGIVDELVDVFDADATLETEWGTVFRGHESLRKWVAQAMKESGGRTARVSRPTLSRAITRDVIVTHGVTFYTFSSGVEDRLFHTRILLRTDTDWKIAAEQIARPSTMSQTTVVMP